MRKKTPLRILAVSVLTLLGAGLVATPAMAQRSAAVEAGTSAAVLESCSSRGPGAGFVYAGAFVGTTSCSRCIAAGWDGVHGEAWRSFTCWTTVSGPGEWRTHELWVKGF